MELIFHAKGKRFEEEGLKEERLNKEEVQQEDSTIQDQGHNEGLQGKRARVRHEDRPDQGRRQGREGLLSPQVMECAGLGPCLTKIFKTS